MIQAHEVIMNGIRKRAEQSELEKLREQNREMLAALTLSADFLGDLATTLTEWARESKEGGWSTHQVDANRKVADGCAILSAQLYRLIRRAEGK